MNMLASEMTAHAPGSGQVIHRLAYILFVQCLRAHAESHSTTCKEQLLRALCDPQIGVGSEVHEKIDARWTLESLA
jgi:hypothetical protein